MINGNNIILCNYGGIETYISLSSFFKIYIIKN